MERYYFVLPLALDKDKKISHKGIEILTTSKLALPLSRRELSDEAGHY